MACRCHPVIPFVFEKDSKPLILDIFIYALAQIIYMSTLSRILSIFCAMKMHHFDRLILAQETPFSGSFGGMTKLWYSRDSRDSRTTRLRLLWSKYSPTLGNCRVVLSAECFVQDFQLPSAAFRPGDGALWEHRARSIARER